MRVSVNGLVLTLAGVSVQAHVYYGVLTLPRYSVVRISKGVLYRLFRVSVAGTFRGSAALKAVYDRSGSSAPEMSHHWSDGSLES